MAKERKNTNRACVLTVVPQESHNVATVVPQESHIGFQVRQLDLRTGKRNFQAYKSFTFQGRKVRGFCCIRPQASRTSYLRREPKYHSTNPGLSTALHSTRFPQSRQAVVQLISGLWTVAKVALAPRRRPKSVSVWRCHASQQESTNGSRPVDPKPALGVDLGKSLSTIDVMLLVSDTAKPLVSVSIQNGE